MNFTENQIDEIADALQTIANEKCDFTGWNRTEAIAMLAQALDRYNNNQEGK